MCTGICLDNIVVCPACKRDDEGYRLGESEPPFVDLSGGWYRCICGRVFQDEKHSSEIHGKQAVSSL